MEESTGGGGVGSPVLGSSARNGPMFASTLRMSGLEVLLDGKEEAAHRAAPIEVLGMEVMQAGISTDRGAW